MMLRMWHPKMVLLYVSILQAKCCILLCIFVHILDCLFAETYIIHYSTRRALLHACVKWRLTVQHSSRTMFANNYSKSWQFCHACIILLFRVGVWRISILTYTLPYYYNESELAAVQPWIFWTLWYVFFWSGIEVEWKVV